MSENQLGRNIQSLRLSHNETLDDLGKVIGYQKSTVKGYENGSREPDLDAFATSGMIRGSIIEDIMDGFINAADELECPEIYANIVWTLFLLWSQIMDTDKTIELQRRTFPGKINIDEFIKVRKNEPAEITKKKKEFIDDFDELFNLSIAILKTDIELSDLGDYYLAMKYVQNMVDTEYSSEMNITVGMQMMIALTKTGNKYAYDFIKRSSEF